MINLLIVIIYLAIVFDQKWWYLSEVDDRAIAL